jgi:hypothetical protein
MIFFSRKPEIGQTVHRCNGFSVPNSLLNNPFSDESTSRNTAVFDGSGRRKAFFNRLLMEGGKPVDAGNQSLRNLSPSWISAQTTLGGSGLI